MKPAFVSLLLVLGACDLPTEPPAPKLPGSPDENGSIVITGRVVNVADGAPLEAVSVRVVEAGVSVGTNEDGTYRIALPERLRGRPISVLVRMIGFKPQNRIVTITSDRLANDFAIEVSSLKLTCTLTWR